MNAIQWSEAWYCWVAYQFDEPKFVILDHGPECADRLPSDPWGIHEVICISRMMEEYDFMPTAKFEGTLDECKAKASELVYQA